MFNDVVSFGSVKVKVCDVPVPILVFKQVSQILALFAIGLANRWPRPKLTPLVEVLLCQARQDAHKQTEQCFDDVTELTVYSCLCIFSWDRSILVCPR